MMTNLEKEASNDGARVSGMEELPRNWRIL
jgi:hypothetical protein